MRTIDTGDKVRHKKDNTYNILQMNVKESDEGKVLCDYFDKEEKSFKDKWFDKDELELIQKAEGGFFNG